MGWERKGCFVSPGMAKPDVEKGGEIFRFWLKSTIQRIKNWHPISNNTSSQIALRPFASTSGRVFPPPRGDFPGHFLLYICGGFAPEACRTTSAMQIKGIHLQSSSWNKGQCWEIYHWKLLKNELQILINCNFSKNSVSMFAKNFFKKYCGISFPKLLYFPFTLFQRHFWKVFHS